MTRYALLLLAALSACSSAETLTSSENALESSDPLASAASIAGTYDGASTVYGLDANDQVVPRYTFTEHIVAENPKIADGRAFVSVTDAISGMPQPVLWNEGFYILADGTLGNRYYAVTAPRPAPEVIETMLGTSGAATFETEVSEQDIADLGFAGRDITFKKHRTVKNVVKNGNVETDVISRVTTITWKAQDGSLQTRQFVSMNGYQARVLSN